MITHDILNEELERWKSLAQRVRAARDDPGMQWGQKRAELEFEAALEALLEGPSVDLVRLTTAPRPKPNTPCDARALAGMLQAAATKPSDQHKSLMNRCVEALQFMAGQVELPGSLLNQAHPLPETDYWDDTADLSAIANEQKEFEEWFAFDAGEVLNPAWAEKDGNGNYTMPDVRDRWGAWQARAARVTDVPRAVADNRLLMRAFEAVHQRSASMPPDINAVLHANLGTLYIEDDQPPETGKEK